MPWAWKFPFVEMSAKSRESARRQEQSSARIHVSYPGIPTLERTTFMKNLWLSFLAIGAMASFTVAAEPKYRVLGCDKGRVAIVDANGKVEWQMPLRFGGAHDVWLLPNGNLLLHTGRATVEEIAPERKTVWKYTAKPLKKKGRVEIHAFQRLANGNTLVAESGNCRLVEVSPEGKIVKAIPLTVKKPHPHRDTRLARKIANGNYLVAHEGDGCVREYDPLGKVVWSYQLDLGGRPRSPGHGIKGHGIEVFSALRLPNGNTLIGGGNNNRVLEINPKGKVVWTLDQKELPGITLAWVTTLHVLPNGNRIIGNCHAGPDNPQLFEITKDKKVVWTFKNHKVFGNNLAAAQVLDLPKGTLR